MKDSEAWCTVTVLQRDGTALQRWPLHRAGSPGLADIDRLARLQLAMQRHGLTVRLDDVREDLGGLLALCGLARLLCGQVQREPEEGKDPLGVEEEVQGGDPAR